VYVCVRESPNPTSQRDDTATSPLFFTLHSSHSSRSGFLSSDFLFKLCWHPLPLRVINLLTNFLILLTTLLDSSTGTAQLACRAPPLSPPPSTKAQVCRHWPYTSPHLRKDFSVIGSTVLGTEFVGLRSSYLFFLQC